MQAYYCSICESLLLHVKGVFCDSCGVCADRACIKIADKKLKCKSITLANDQPMKHQWTLGTSLFILFVCENKKNIINKIHYNDG